MMETGKAETVAAVEAELRRLSSECADAKIRKLLGQGKLTPAMVDHAKALLLGQRITLEIGGKQKSVCDAFTAFMEALPAGACLSKEEKPDADSITLHDAMMEEEAESKSPRSHEEMAAEMKGDAQPGQKWMRLYEVSRVALDIQHLILIARYAAHDAADDDISDATVGRHQLMDAACIVLDIANEKADTLVSQF